MKKTICRGIARMSPTHAGGSRVLLYHALGDPDPVDRMALRVPRQQFVEQMSLLRDEGYAVVPLTSVQQGTGGNDRTRVAITFDDGYRDQLWGAEVLREFGFPATFFLVPRFLDGQFEPARYWERWGHMGWDDAATLAAGGFELGAHSTTHPDLRTCSDAQLEDEITGVRDRLEQRFGKPVSTFSYPYGRHDARVRRAVARAGYRVACTSRYGINRGVGSSYAVHRTEVGGADDLKTFQLKLRGKYDWLGYWQDLVSWVDAGIRTDVDRE